MEFTVWSSIAIVIAAYIFIIFFLSRLLVPNIRFWREKLPEKIPKSMEKAIQEIKKKSKTKHQFLENAYNYITKNYFGSSVMTFPFIYYLWKPVEFLWEKKGFLHCGVHNLFLRIFLIKSGMFKEEDIKRIHTVVDLNIHQYLEVKTEKGWIPVDIWSSAYGCKLGERPAKWHLA